MASVIATVDAITPLRDGIAAYLGHVDRLGAGAPPVAAGEWTTELNSGPPMVVIGAIGPFKYSGAAAVDRSLRSTPSYTWDFGTGFAAPVVGVRDQTFAMWAHSVVPDFSAHDPSAYALDNRIATLALSDLVFAALRDLTGHDFDGEPGEPFGEVRGEFVFGSTVKWGFVIPVPVLGDLYPYVTPAGATATALFQGTAPGDPLTT